MNLLFQRLNPAVCITFDLPFTLTARGTQRVLAAVRVIHCPSEADGGKPTELLSLGFDAVLPET